MMETETATKNTLLRGQVALWQPENGYRMSIDSVLLAAACHPGSGARVLDLGCGVGTVGLCLHYFQNDIQLKGIDIQPDMITLARKNADENACNAAEFKLENITEMSEGGYDYVVTNPPYYEDGANTPSPLLPWATAHSGRLEDWVAAAARNLKKGGTFSAILPAQRFDEMLWLLRKYQFGSLHILPLFPKSGRPAKRLIFQARLHKRGSTVFHQGIVLHENNNAYTKQAELILQGANKLSKLQ
jgi:tRNA1(Val) A37 N6-methylase TrmN6